ncbi:BMP family ABC transporter substrate-binding protein [Virgibacillus sp. MG-45]|uniref:BMP family ABC transporter substrate-binding protein n=1 Tax=Virgibacillus sp. MG-45 TaxID=3102791 RepID=UPI003FCD8574
MPTLKRFILIQLIMISLLIVAGCGDMAHQGNLEKVGMLVEGTIKEKSWDTKGYEGLQHIKDSFDVDVFYKENVKTEQDVLDAVDEFAHKGVNLIFGHSSSFGKYFVDISELYPDVHFVYFNGSYSSNNVTSFNFNGHVMGFFAGMVAGKMTLTDQVGIIAAYEWQPEVEGFYEGVKFQNPSANVLIDYVHDWNETEKAVDMYEEMKKKRADVFYPVGDAFSKKILELAANDYLYAIGYVMDQSNVDPDAVLTSTVQHVDMLYSLAAEKFNKSKLKGKVYSFDFKNNIISLSPFSRIVPESFQLTLNKAIDEYKETGLLPNQYADQQ